MNNLQAFLVISLGILFIHTASLQAQNQDKKTWITTYFGHHEYHGDIGNEMGAFNLGDDWAGGIGVSRYLSPNWDIEASAIYGKLDYSPESGPYLDQGFSNEFINLNALVKFKPLDSFSPVQPFVATGLGITPFFNGEKYFPGLTQEIQNFAAFSIPLQGGMDIRVTDNIHVTLNATYNRTYSDGIDKIGSQFDTDGRNHDDFVVFSAGLKFAASRSTDRDRDGVPNERDACPNVYGNSFFGCPDQDEDGVSDRNDDCPTIPGSRNLNGCPDADKDGISDIQDACPKEWGRPQNNGCPDSDDDGVIDKEDACPQQPGDPANEGCPADTDGDGITDEKDQCPNTPGPESNNGCPVEEEKPAEDSDQWETELQTIANNLQFDSNSSTLAQSSYDDLIRLAEMMLEDSALRLIIRGHTDNVGDDNQNLKLSVDRANAVKDYLVSQGVESSRIFAFGYGETRPVASNETEEGRRQNRRVELELYRK
ncbi:OmpA family protein [Halalkalibaculum sp. DA3122]|uniref:OmpA family protein n=1 Tax=unclassified Halalkalibaculum TaxID=2964617 RepID=UPI00375430D6